MNAEQLLTAQQLMAKIQDYGYACKQSQELASRGQLTASTSPQHYANELFEEVTREVYRLHQLPGAVPEYCRLHGVRADEHVNECAS